MTLAMQHGDVEVGRSLTITSNLHCVWQAPSVYLKEAVAYVLSVLNWVAVFCLV